MRQLVPTPIDSVDPLGLYLTDDRPPPAGRPWVMCNMIASLDGATALDGVSGGLGGAADKAVFRAIRASCDWVLVASATAVPSDIGCRSRATNLKPLAPATAELLHHSSRL